jgi:hypothetical protein
LRAYCRLVHGSAVRRSSPDLRLSLSKPGAGLKLCLGPTYPRGPARSRRSQPQKTHRLPTTCTRKITVNSPQNTRPHPLSKPVTRETNPGLIQAHQQSLQFLTGDLKTRETNPILYNAIPSTHLHGISTRPARSCGGTHDSDTPASAESAAVATKEALRV